MNSKNKVVSLIPLVLGAFLLLSSCASTAQLSSGDKQASFLGMVYDTERNPVADALVTITLEDKVLVESRSDIKGRFTIKSLPFGTYLLTITHPNNETRKDMVRFESVSDVYYGRMISFKQLYALGLKQLTNGSNAELSGIIDRMLDSSAPKDMVNLLIAGRFIVFEDKSKALVTLNRMLDGRQSDFEVLVFMADLAVNQKADKELIKILMERALQVREDDEVRRRLNAL